MSAWFVPDLALFVSFVTLFFCLVVFDGSRQLFRDSDAGWHIRTGEAILAGGGLPRTDPYSFSKAGQPWFAWEWGADAVMGAMHRLGGLRYVAALYAVLISICTWLWFRLHWAVGGNFLIAAGMATLMLSTGNIHWLARPHVFSWVLLLGFVLYLERGGRNLLVVAAVSVAWANLHASFFLAPVVLALYALPVAAVVSALATLVNPYGWELHRHVISYLSNTDLLSRIGEYQTFNFHSPGSTQILLTVLVAGFGGTLALTQGRVRHFLLAVLFLSMGLRSARVLPLIGFVLLPLANGAITRWLRDMPRFRSALTYGDNLRSIDSRQIGFVWAPVVLAAVFALPMRAGFPPDQFPVAAAERVPAEARLLAPDMYGGYLIYRFNGERKVFFDGRSDFYGLDFMKDYLKLVEVRPGWREVEAKYGFTHALLPVRYSLIPALEQLGWKRLYSDDVAVLLEKNR
jgi:hypothetical protein